MSDEQLLSKYRDAVSQPPAKGYVLKTLDDSPVVLHVQLEDGKPPFIYGRAFLSEILDSTLGWYARGLDDDKVVGWKCVLMTQARRAVVQRCGDQLAEGKLTVKSLKVVRPSESGRALLCEVNEFCDPTPIETEPAESVSVSDGGDQPDSDGTFGSLATRLSAAPPVSELPSPVPNDAIAVGEEVPDTGGGSEETGEEPSVQ
jgi:hypothetical protein